MISANNGPDTAMLIHVSHLYRQIVTLAPKREHTLVIIAQDLNPKPLKSMERPSGFESGPILARIADQALHSPCLLVSITHVVN